MNEPIQIIEIAEAMEAYPDLLQHRNTLPEPGRGDIRPYQRIVTVMPPKIPLTVLYQPDRTILPDWVNNTETWEKVEIYEPASTSVTRYSVWRNIRTKLAFR